MMLGRPRLHLRATDSTNRRARALAAAGAPHGTLVTAAEQTAGRGRQGRSWIAPAGRALLMSVVVRDVVPLLPLRAGIAVAEIVGAGAQVKWPNDVWLDGRKVAGVLVEGRPAEGWAVVGTGLNVAIDLADLPPDLRATAGTLGLGPEAVEPTLSALLVALERALGEPAASVLDALRSRDALLGRPVRWEAGEGVGAGIDETGRLLVDLADGSRAALDAGEVHLGPATPGPPPPGPRAP